MRDSDPFPEQWLFVESMRSLVNSASVNLVDRLANQVRHRNAALPGQGAQALRLLRFEGDLRTLHGCNDTT